MTLEGGVPLVIVILEYELLPLQISNNLAPSEYFLPILFSQASRFPGNGEFTD